MNPQQEMCARTPSLTNTFLGGGETTVWQPLSHFRKQMEGFISAFLINDLASCGHTDIYIYQDQCLAEPMANFSLKPIEVQRVSELM